MSRNSSISALGDGRAALVDLGRLAVGRVVDGGVGARLLADAHEVVEDRLRRQLLDDARPGRARRRSPVAITGWPSAFRPRATLTPLPPGIVVCSTVRWRRPRRKFGHRERLVDRGVERDGDDHAISVVSRASAPCRRALRRRRHITRYTVQASEGGARAGSAGPCGGAPSTRPSALRRRPRRSPRAVTSGTRATTCPRWRTSIVPTREPAGSGPSIVAGRAEHRRVVSCSPRAAVRPTVLAGDERARVVAVGAAPRGRTTVALLDRVDDVVLGQAVAQQRQRVAVARGLDGSSRTALMTVIPSRVAEPTRQ